MRRDSKFAEAVDAIADNCGRDFKQMTLSGNAGLSRTDVHAIATLPPRKQKEAFSTNPKKVAARLRKKAARDWRDKRRATAIRDLEYIFNIESRESHVREYIQSLLEEWPKEHHEHLCGVITEELEAITKAVKDIATAARRAAQPKRM